MSDMFQGGPAGSQTRRLFLFAAGAAIVGVHAAGCGEKPEQSAPTVRSDTASPILLIAVDGVEWDVVVPLLAEGRLPNLARLMERGTYGYLETFEPTSSPIIWTSVATGKPAILHGINGFVRRVEGGRQLYTSADRRTKALWNILSDYDKRVAVVGWWITYPVEQVNGVMVAQTNTTDQLNTAGGRMVMKGALRDDLPRQVYPPAREAELLAVLADVERDRADLTMRIFGDFRHELSALGQRLWANCRWAFRADETYSRITRLLLDEGPRFDVTMVYFGGPDVVGHRFWRYRQPELYEYPPTADQVENFGKIIDDYYSYTDVRIGELLAAAGRETNVLLVSDHGMKPVNLGQEFDPNDPPADVNSANHTNAEPGVIIAAGPAFRTSSPRRDPRRLSLEELRPIGTVFDIAPTMLAMLRIPVGHDMSGRVMADLLQPEFEIESQPRPVVTHDTREFLANRPKRGTRPAGEQERLKQLRSLGYIGGPDDDN